MDSLSQTAKNKGLSAYDLVLMRRTALFRRLKEDALARMLAPAVVTTVPRGQNLFVQGQEAERFYVLLSGWVKLYRMTAEGAEAVVTIVAPGESFAEAALFLSARYPVSAEAVDRARLLSFAAADFARLMGEDSGLAMAMLASLSVRLHGLVSQIEQLHAHSSPKRVGHFFLKLCSDKTGLVAFDLPFDKALLARRLGMQPETFSRALRQLREIGVATQGPKVTVADVAALREFCGDIGDE
jgi:CRP/FNR family transcriptional regulator, dissimilatory nitrate respiration regulator